MVILHCSRWVRLLLSREFDLDDTLVIWTAIFADGVNLDLIDSLCVALLVYIREFGTHALAICGRCARWHSRVLASSRCAMRAAA